MTVKITREEMTSTELRIVASKSSDAKAARRMLAIAFLLEGTDRETAAETCGMTRQTLRDWVHRYNDEGLAGLVNRKAPGARPALSAVQKQEIAAWVRTGPNPEKDNVVRWRCVDLQRKIKEVFAVEIHERSVGKLLHELGFRRLSARPQHPKSDEAAQAAFKKLRRQGGWRSPDDNSREEAGNLVSR